MISPGLLDGNPPTAVGCSGGDLARFRASAGLAQGKAPDGCEVFHALYPFPVLMPALRCRV